VKPPVIFADEAILVIDKPAGVKVDQIQQQTQAILVHRLDRDTSGVMVLAKTESSAQDLRKQFEERRVVKKYLALVHGTMKSDSGLITTPLAKHPKNKARVTVGGSTDRSAITEWRRIQSYLGRADGIESYSLLELTPHTGRTHQLRVHLKSIQHPIVADPLYGFAKKLAADLAWCPRLFLHAQLLQFRHPTTSQIVTFTAPLPADLALVLTRI